MLRKILAVFLLFAVGLVHAEGVTVLAYHDISPQGSSDFYTVTRPDFIAQMDYLQQNGYHPISLAQLQQIKQGKMVLPKQAVLLTFDDGLHSYARFVVPLLKIYGFPSVASVVTAWADGKDQPPEYVGHLLDWDELKALSREPSVEIISHSHDLHHGANGNPQGKDLPVSVTRHYISAIGNYESETQFRQRIADDLSTSVERLRSHLGKAPVGITWPYGRYDGVVVDAARGLGLEFQLTLDEGMTQLADLPYLKRVMVNRDMGAQGLASWLAVPAQTARINKRMLEISLDEFQGKTPQEQEILLTKLTDRLRQLNINTVVVSPFTKQGQPLFFTEQVEAGVHTLGWVLHQLRDRLRLRYAYLRFDQLDDVSKQFTQYTDLARLNWFNGAIVPAQAKSEDLRLLKTLLSRYHPGLQFGALGITADTGLFDFVVTELNQGATQVELSQRLIELTGSVNEVCVLLQRGGNDLMLRDALRTLRAAGIRNYGYGPDDYVNNRPDVSLMAKELVQLGMGEGG